MHRLQEQQCVTCRRSTNRYVQLQGFFVNQSSVESQEADKDSKSGQLSTYQQCMMCIINNSNPFYELVHFLEHPYLLNSTLTTNTKVYLPATLTTQVPKGKFGLALVQNNVPSRSKLFWPFPVQLQVNGETQYVHSKQPTWTYTVLEPKYDSRSERSYCQFSLTFDRKELIGTYYLMFFLIREVDFTVMYETKERNERSLDFRYQKMLKSNPEGLCFSLVCPVTGYPIRYPVRFAECTHLQCFDIRYYQRLPRNTSTIKCPICGRRNNPLVSFIPDFKQKALMDRIQTNIFSSLSEEERTQNPMVYIRNSLDEFTLGNIDDSRLVTASEEFAK